MDRKPKFVLCALGIFVSFFCFGILQEKVTKGKYPIIIVQENGTIQEEYELYTYTFSLIFSQCYLSYICAKTVTLFKHQHTKINKELFMLYGTASLTLLLAMVCSTMALKWIPYPTQVIQKSAKPLPIMLLGVLIGNKSYPAKKYIFISLVVIGVFLFMYNDQHDFKSDETIFGFGEILVIISLIMDGLMGGLQERIRSQDSKPSGQQMMLNMNFCSCIYLSIALIGLGEGRMFIYFVNRHRMVLFNIAALSVAAAIGQHFIYEMVAEFGPLPVAIVTTTRKFVTVLVSVLFFGNHIGIIQWIAAVIVFSALFLDAYFSKPSNGQVSMQQLYQ